MTWLNLPAKSERCDHGDKTPAENINSSSPAGPVVGRHDGRLESSSDEFIFLRKKMLVMS